MPFDGAKLSQTAQQLINLQKVIQERGELGWVRGMWETGSKTQHCLLGLLLDANGGYQDMMRNNSLHGPLKGAVRALMLCLPETSWDTQEVNTVMYFNDQLANFAAICSLVDRAVEAEVKKCLVRNVTVGS